MKLQLDAIIAVAVAILLAILVVWGNAKYSRLLAAADAGKAAVPILQQTSAAVQQVQTQQAERQVVEVQVSEAKQTWHQQTAKEEAHEPILRNRGDQSVPDSVRARAKERRLARERSGQPEPGR